MNKKYSPDELSYKLGKLDQDCYLISRGVRFIGTHQFSNTDYKKAKNYIKNLIESSGLEYKIDIDKQVEIIIYHPQKGKKYLNKLQQIDKERDKYESNKKAAKVIEKLINNEELSPSEKKLLAKINKENKELEIEYGKIFGYSKEAINKFIKENDF